LSRDLIVQAALDLGRRRGADGFTMRELADELGVTPMATYYYVDSKETLVTLVADAVLASVEIPTPAFGAWDARLRELTRSRRDAIASFPGLRTALGQAGDSQHIRRLEDATLQILLDEGFDVTSAVMAFRFYLDWFTGHTSIDLMLRDATRRRPRQQWTKALRLTLGSSESQLHADDYFEHGLDAAIEGMRQLLGAAQR
jgi:AcrR family transcriptional regulator